MLAGVCFPLGMYWGQSFWSRSDLSHRNVPFKWFNHLILTPPPPLGGFNSRWVHGPVSCFELLFLGLVRSLQQFHFQIQCVLKKSLHIFFRPGTVDHLLNVELRHNVDGVPKTTFYSTLTGKTTSWISLILFPALLYSHLFNVELRHNVAGVPKTFVLYLDGENHVLDLSNTIPCLVILSPLQCWA